MTDEFTLGQWLRGRIYERRADISPDGRYLIYFAMNGKWSSETKGSWTAVSRAPWLKAIVLLGKGDCWLGGGLFTGKSKYWLNGDGFVIRDSPEVQRNTHFKPHGQYGGECPSVYYRRLQRDGWTLKDQLKESRSNTWTVFEKPLPKGWILRKNAHAEVSAGPGKGCYWDEHELEKPELEQRRSFPDWEWADLDGRTLVWAAQGCLYRARLESTGLGVPKLLLDFNDMKFEAREAPY